MNKYLFSTDGNIEIKLLISSLFSIDSVTEANIIKELKEFNSKFAFTTSNNRDEIRTFLNDSYSYIKHKLDNKIKSISTKDNLEKFSKEHTLSAQVYLSNDSDIMENFYGSKNYSYRAQYYRRAIKYIIENICFFSNKTKSPSSSITNDQVFTKIIVLTEELSRICGDLDLTNIFNSNLILTNNYSNNSPDFYSLTTPCKDIVSNFDPNFYIDPDLHFERNNPKVFSTEINDLVETLFKQIYGVSLYLIK